jgi:hypothetical protein
MEEIFKKLHNIESGRGLDMLNVYKPQPKKPEDKPFAEEYAKLINKQPVRREIASYTNSAESNISVKQTPPMVNKSKPKRKYEPSGSPESANKFDAIFKKSEEQKKTDEQRFRRLKEHRKDQEITAFEKVLKSTEYKKVSGLISEIDRNDDACSYNVQFKDMAKQTVQQNTKGTFLNDLFGIPKEALKKSPNKANDTSNNSYSMLHSMIQKDSILEAVEEKGTESPGSDELSGHDKSLRSIKPSSNNANISLSHINPVPSKKENVFKYYSFTMKDVYYKVLSHEFYREPNEKNISVIPKIFEDHYEYRYHWLSNFYRELKSNLIASKIERSEVERYKNRKITMTFNSDGKLKDYIVYLKGVTNEQKNLVFKVFKDNDIIAFYDNKLVTESDVDFFNEDNLPYSFGLIKMKKNPQDIHEVKCKVLELAQVKENTEYSIKLLGNLTSMTREFKSVLNINQSVLGTAIFNPTTLLQNQLDFSTNEVVYKDPFCERLLQANYFNESQKIAIAKVSEMNSKDIMLIQGPPGTGKTHAIIGILSYFYNIPNSKILVCAPSNTAIDEIAYRLACKGLIDKTLNYKTPEFIRFGVVDQQKEKDAMVINEAEKSLKRFSLEELVDKEFKERERLLQEQLEKLRTQLDEIDAKISKEGKPKRGKKKKQQLEEGEIQSNNDVDDRESGEDLYRQKRELQNLYRSLKLDRMNQNNERRIYEKRLLDNARILCTTLNSSGNDKFISYNLKYDFLVIDEACQCTEPSCIIPFNLGIKKVVMIGDHLQLPATVFSDTAKKTKYDRSMFERLVDNNYPKFLLNMQYRMHSNIREFIGKTFYDNSLIDANQTQIQSSKIYKVISEANNFAFFNIKSKETYIEYSKSYANKEEAEFIISLINSIQEEINDYNRIDYFSTNKFQVKYAVIAPYKAQVKELIEMINKHCSEIAQYIEVNTVDSFQGREQEIVIISTVRSNYNSDYSNVGFLNDLRRMNVALSRAKYACYVVGNVETLISDEYWFKLIDFCATKGNLFPMRLKYFKRNLDNIKSLIKTGKLADCPQQSINPFEGTSFDSNNTHVFKEDLNDLLNRINKQKKNPNAFIKKDYTNKTKEQHRAQKEIINLCANEDAKIEEIDCLLAQMKNNNIKSVERWRPERKEKPVDKKPVNKDRDFLGKKIIKLEEKKGITVKKQRLDVDESRKKIHKLYKPDDSMIVDLTEDSPVHGKDCYVELN